MKLAPLNLCFTLIIALLSVATTRAATNTVATAPERFLVIVETSSVMQKRADNIQKALGGSISSGLKGELPSGSTIGLWTFNDKLLTGQVPLQTWTEASRQHVALNLVQAVQQQKYEKTARLSVVWSAATNIVAQSDYITLLLFTSGSEPVTGTPYDTAIAESFRQNAEQQRKANMPFVTILRAVKGKFVAYAVNMPPWPLDMPEWPAELKPKPAKPAPAVAAPAAAVPPLIVKRSDPAVLSPTNTIYFVEPTPTNGASATPPAPQVQPTNPVVIAPPAVAAPHPNPPVAAATVETKPQPPAEPKPEAKPEAKLAASAPAQLEPKRSIIPFLIAGIGALLVVLVAILILLRRSRRSAGESLITRSMNQRNR